MDAKWCYVNCDAKDKNIGQKTIDFVCYDIPNCYVKKKK